ncbi:MAG: HigA family addiction module antidote protein [Candidatus Eisenbacteria bacterium]|nr:HigA family addiction module antidote protein [Candidatus Eisenbacteria bacterium]
MGGASGAAQRVRRAAIWPVARRRRRSLQHPRPRSAPRLPSVEKGPCRRSRNHGRPLGAREAVARDDASREANTAAFPANAPTHPGEMLREAFLEPLGITQTEMATHLGISFQWLNEIVRGRRGVTSGTASRLERVLGASVGFWLGLRQDRDL